MPFECDQQDDIITMRKQVAMYFTRFLGIILFKDFFSGFIICRVKMTRFPKSTSMETWRERKKFNLIKVYL